MLFLTLVENFLGLLEINKPIKNVLAIWFQIRFCLCFQAFFICTKQSKNRLQSSRHSSMVSMAVIFSQTLNCVVMFFWLVSFSLFVLNYRSYKTIIINRWTKIKLIKYHTCQLNVQIFICVVLSCCSKKILMCR